MKGWWLSILLKGMVAKRLRPILRNYGVKELRRNTEDLKIEVGDLGTRAGNLRACPVSYVLTSA
jgi:hypothetical protein